jgi:GTP-binding protein
MEKEDELLLFSGETGEGKEQAWGVLKKYM